MKRVCLSFLMFFVLTFSFSVLGQDVNPIRILLVVGGHSYDQENLHKMLAEMPNATFHEISIPDQQDILKPGLSEKFDVVVFHDQSFFELTEDQKTNLTNLWTEGMPTVMLHHALISHNDFPLFREVYGTAYLVKELEIDGQQYEASSYLHPTDVHFIIENKNHPITKDLDDFSINDEVFNHLYFNPGINVLIKTDHPESSEPIVWTWHYKKSPVFAIVPGHDGNAFNNEHYRTIFYRGVQWLINESQKESVKN
ncbi:MAG: ThuA domain-containing protein [Planctomycetia bacterium]|nr:ThuA domain-containing protein [Planctomycetia bacterium]